MSEPTGSVQFLNLNATAQAITLGKAQIVAILALNTTGVTVFVQIFDLELVGISSFFSRKKA